MGCTVNVEEGGQCSWNAAASDTVAEDLKSQSKWNCLYVESKKKMPQKNLFTKQIQKTNLRWPMGWGGEVQIGRLESTYTHYYM